MSHPERDFRRITSIPPRTSLDVLRGRVTVRIGASGLLGGVRRVYREPIVREPNWSQTVAKHVFQKPPGWEKARPEPLYRRDRKIEWETEVIEDYNGKGDLGIILQFAGIELTKASFLRSRHNRPDLPVFYIPIGYNKKMVRLFLATRGNILEFQIAPDQMGGNPFFREELCLPELVKTYDPTSMAASQNNGLIIIDYNPLTTV